MASADPRHRLGRAGEKEAERFLRRRGLKVLARRFDTPRGEIDLIMKDGQTIVFVEVKTLQSRQHADPQDAVTPRKQRHLAAAAHCYLHQRRLLEHPARFDIVAVIIPEDGPTEVDHFTDAFSPPNW
jgi:putative endonuclease